MSWRSWKYSAPFGCAATFSWPLMSLRPARDMSLGRWLLVACFSSVKNHNVSGPHLFPSFTTYQKNPFATPGTVLQRSKKSLCNRSQFRTLLLPHRFIRIRPSHQRPVSIESLKICRIPGFHKSEQNRKSCGNVQIWRKRAAVRRKNHSNLKKSFGMKMSNEARTGVWWPRWFGKNTDWISRQMWGRRRFGWHADLSGTLIWPQLRFGGHADVRGTQIWPARRRGWRADLTGTTDEKNWSQLLFWLMLLLLLRKK